MELSDLAIAKMYLSKEHNQDISDAFNEFAATETSQAEAKVLEQLAMLQKKYPQFVYLPFIRVYNAMVEGRK